MPIEEYELLLKGVANNSKVKTSEQAEIISQLEHQMKAQPEEAITSLTNSKHSSSLQSLIHNKEKGRNHHKVPYGTVNNSRPGDLYQQQNQSVINSSATKPIIPTFTPAISSASVGSNNHPLPPQYYFNCAQDVGQPISGQEKSPESDRDNNPESHSSEIGYYLPELNEDRRNKSNIELRGAYSSVHTPTSVGGLPLANSADRSHFNESSHHHQSIHSSHISSGTGLPSSAAAKTNPDPFKKLDESHGRKKSKTKDKKNKREQEYIIPTRSTDYTVDAAVQFVEGTPLEGTLLGKRGNKKKERGDNRRKNYGGEPLVKSMSLDDDNLSIAAKKTGGDRGDRTGSLKGSSNTDTSSSTSNLQSSSSTRTSSEKENNNRSDKEKKDKESFASQVVTNPNNNSNNNNNNNNNNNTNNNNNIVIDTWESDVEDSKSPVRQKPEPFTVVIRKRKNKTGNIITSPIGNSVGKEEEKREESSRKSRSNRERRKSVGSVPGSDQSEGSDDGSVRSLPAGECTKRENIPKSCASSGGTPQTSYADIARLTKDEDVKKELPQALEDYPSLQGFENSEGSDDGSERSVHPVDEIIQKDVASKPSSTSGGGGGIPLTSYADIARLASHEEKKEDRKEQPCEDFPELNSTVSGVSSSHESATELLPSPKSDSSVPTSNKYAPNNDSAFPQLTASSGASRNSGTQGSVTPKTMSSVLSANTTTAAAGTPKVTNSLPASSSCGVPRAPTPTQKAQINSPSPAFVFATHPPVIRDTGNNISGAGVGSSSSSSSSVVKVSVVTPSSPAGVPSRNSTSESEAKGTTATITTGTTITVAPTAATVKSRVHTSSNNTQREVISVCVNGHLSDNERDTVIKQSDIPGAKMEKSAFSIVAPQQFNVDSSGAGQCTEAVVFCGENFKEPPQLPSKDLMFEFGFNVSEVLDDINKKVPPEIANQKSISSKQTKGKNPPPPPPKDGQSQKVYQQSSNSSGKPLSHFPPPGRDDGRRRDVERSDSNRVSNSKNESVGYRKPAGMGGHTDMEDKILPSPPIVSDAQEVVSNKAEVRVVPPPPSVTSERSQSYKAAQHKGGHNAKKPFQTVQPVLAEGGVVVVPPQVAAQSSGASVPAELYQKPGILPQYPLVPPPPIQVHGGGGPVVHPNAYGMAGYVTTTPPLNYPNRLPTAPPPHMTGAGVVQMPAPAPPTLSYDGSLNQYISSVYQRGPPAPVATVSSQDDHHSTTGNAQPAQVPLSTPVVVTPEYVGSAPGGGGQGQRQAHGQHRGYYHQVPAQNNVPKSDATDSVSNPPDTREANSATTLCRSPAQPINLGSYYDPPNPARYSSVNVEDLRNYLGRRARECELLQSQPSTQVLDLSVD